MRTEEVMTAVRCAALVVHVSRQRCDATGKIDLQSANEAVLPQDVLTSSDCKLRTAFRVRKHNSSLLLCTVLAVNE